MRQLAYFYKNYGLYLKNLMKVVIISSFVMIIMTITFSNYEMSIKEIRKEQISELERSLSIDLSKQAEFYDMAFYRFHSYQFNLQDLRDFLSLDYNDYYQKYLKNFDEKNYDSFRRTDKIINQLFLENAQLSMIVLKSYEAGRVIYFTRNSKVPHYLETRYPKEDMDYLETIPNYKSEKRSVFLREWYDNYSQSPVATILLAFDMSVFSEKASKVEEFVQFRSFKNEQLIFSEGETFDTKGTLQSELQLGSNFTLTTIVNEKNILNQVSLQNMYYKILTIVFILLIICFYLWKTLREEQRRTFLLNKIRLIQHGERELPKSKVIDAFTEVDNGIEQMWENLQQMIQERYLQKIRLNNAELQALRAQIRPHFLYNTLEIIRMRALLQDEKETAELLFSLSQLFRSAIRGGGDIPLKEEVALTEHYLSLFEIRYENSFFYSLEIDVGMENYAIEKLLLQPIIENYFVHGFDVSREDNFLEISITQDEQFMHIFIQDNGQGMSEEELQSISRKLSTKMQEDETEHLGLLNIHRRISLGHGEEYGVSIYKNHLNGITVHILYPIKMWEKKDENSDS
ncbi:Histidine kinase [Pilibacter termitis]|uniref:Histidine kinase n=1 Tax=Pilibacter termitis TaxID=263852 RepID=A0A1T4RA56_9ENTE|nr:histidine kinase [Pilibacter termitis]SKA12501.1 Histidine kinase [Pilibacter termitis]